MGSYTKKTSIYPEKRRKTEEVGRGMKDVEREEVVKKIIMSDGGRSRKEGQNGERKLGSRKKKSKD